MRWHVCATISPHLPSQVYERLEELDSDNAESRAAQLLSGLGFDKEMMEQPTRSHSGGWRMRIALAVVREIIRMRLLSHFPTHLQSHTHPHLHSHRHGEEMMEQPTRLHSCGWRMRMAMAALGPSAHTSVHTSVRTSMSTSVHTPPFTPP